MSRRTYGLLAGFIGSALAAWWWSRQNASSVAPRGTVIYDNTPTASDLSQGLI